MLKFGLILFVAIISFSAVQLPQSYKYVRDDFSDKSSLPFRVISAVVDVNLPATQSKVSINFKFDVLPNANQLIYMSINGLLENVEYTPGKKVTYDVTPGKYVFKIWGGPGFDEVITDSIEFKAHTVYETEVDVNQTYNPPSGGMILYKPVLYFHTDKERNLDLNVLPAGEFTFTYPAIENGWKGKINADGSLTVNNRNYPYLFWESKQDYRFKPSTNGYHLKKAEYVAFLEKKCDELGFSATERTDFITFWGMKMQHHEELFIQFLFDDSCDQFAKLEFKEQPDALRRVYIMISQWNSFYEPYLKDIKFKTMPKVNYSVLEWGGYEFKMEENSFTANN